MSIPRIEIFIGACINVESERSTLTHVIDILTKANIDAVVFANLHIGKSQIDFVVATPSFVWVIEAKGHLRPLRGGANGRWQKLLPNGTWGDTDNSYEQALGGVYSVRDAMTKFKKPQPPHPDGVLLFVPRIPAGSDIDARGFKVALLPLEQLQIGVGTRAKPTWTLDDWRNFAKHLRLLPVASIKEAFSPELMQAEALINSYGDSFRLTYGYATSGLVDVECEAKEIRTTTSELIERICSSSSDFLLLGNSGCGKSLIGFSIGTSFAQNGGVPLLLSAKNFFGNLDDVLEHEAFLSGAPDAMALLKAARLANRPLLLIVDGYNECSTTHRPVLTRSVAALARRYNARVVVTSQILMERQELLSGIETITILPPTYDQRIAIAEGCSAKPLSPQIKSLLSTLSNGLESKLAGEIVSSQDVSSFGKHELFDAFVRRRCESSPTKCIRFLAALAGHLSDNLVFSISPVELDRLIEKEQLDEPSLQLLFAANILQKSARRISFSHEMFLHAFVAESIVRRHGQNPVSLSEVIQDPKHADRRDFIVSAVQEYTVLEQVLERLRDHETVAAVFSGVCGQQAAQLCRIKLEQLLPKVYEEPKSVVFALSAGDDHQVFVETSSLVEWTPFELALIKAGAVAHFDELLEDIFSSLQHLDARIQAEWRRLRPDALARGMRALRDPMFVAAVVFANQGPAIAQLVDGITRGISREHSPNAIKGIVDRELESCHLSSAQLYALLKFLGQIRFDATSLARLLTHVIADHWKTAPYHVRLEVIHVSRYCHRANIDVLQELSAAVHSTLGENALFNSIVFEALEGLGALDEDAANHIAIARSELRQALEGDADELRCAAASRIYDAQFDHPFASAYSSVIEELEIGESIVFIKRAALGAQQMGSSFFLSILLLQLLRLGDTECSAILQRWTERIPERTGFVQDNIANFFLAYICLGLLASELPETAAEDDKAAIALRSCGLLLYWLNRKDLHSDERLAKSRAELNFLLSNAQEAALDVFRECEQNLDMRHLEWPVADVVLHPSSMFSTEILELSRSALRSPAEQQVVCHFAPFDRQRTLEYAISHIANYGDSRDAAFLRKLYAADAVLGKASVAAIKKIDMRTSQPV